MVVLVRELRLQAAIIQAPLVLSSSRRAACARSHASRPPTYTTSSLPPESFRSFSRLRPQAVSRITIHRLCRRWTYYPRDHDAGIREAVLKKLSTVLNVHYDDDPPYYTISMDEQERSTVRGYLQPLTLAEDALAGAGSAADGREALEVTIQKVGPLGITLENGPQGTPPKLTVLIPNGAAIRSGLLRLGDLLAIINGQRVYDHPTAARIITASDGVLRMIVLRSIEPPVEERGLGALGPVKAFYGASAPAAPPLRLWAFILPSAPLPASASGGNGLASSSASSSSAGGSSALVSSGSSLASSGGSGSSGGFSTAMSLSSTLASTTPSFDGPNFVFDFLSSHTTFASDGMIGWPHDLPIHLGGGAAVRVAQALADGSWSEAAHAERLRLAATTGSSSSAEQIVAMLASLRSKWATELKVARRERCGAMLVLGEAERASTALEARAKASLRRLHALVALSLVKGHLNSSSQGSLASDGTPSGLPVPYGGYGSSGNLLDLRAVSATEWRAANMLLPSAVNDGLSRVHGAQELHRGRNASRRFNALTGGGLWWRRRRRRYAWAAAA